jgi:hypothetical protein
MNAVPRKRDDLLTRQIAGETIVVPIRGKLADMQRIFAMNPVAEFVWDRIDGLKNVEQISGEVSDHFDVSEAQARSDVLEFVSELAEAGLVESL